MYRVSIASVTLGLLTAATLTSVAAPVFINKKNGQAVSKFYGRAKLLHPEYYKILKFVTKAPLCRAPPQKNYNKI